MDIQSWLSCVITERGSTIATTHLRLTPKPAINHHSYRDDERFLVMPSNDLEAELLRRFQALKAPSTTPGPSFKNISDDRARKAKEEDDELERIAEGRPLSNPPARKGDGAEDEMARRMAKLKGTEYEVEEGNDQEVRFIKRRWAD
jgi:hypothetical protein